MSIVEVLVLSVVKHLVVNDIVEVFEYLVDLLGFLFRVAGGCDVVDWGCAGEGAGGFLFWVLLVVLRG